MEVWFIMTTTAYMIKSFGVVSVGKFCAVIGLIWGLIAGLMVAVGIGGIGSMMGISCSWNRSGYRRADRHDHHRRYRGVYLRGHRGDYL